MLSEEFEHLTYVQLLDKLFECREQMLDALFVRKSNDRISIDNDRYALDYQKADNNFREILDSLKANMKLEFGE